MHVSTLPLARLPWFVACFSIISIGCGNDSTTGTPGDGDDVLAGTDAVRDSTPGTDVAEPPVPCGGCPEGELCVDGACTSEPQGCPCPAESYCDVAEDRCIAGCIGDSNCAAGRICNSATRTCRAGCRLDGDCPGNGNICDPATLVCREGCRNDSNCQGNGAICDLGTLTCRGGCRSDDDCTQAGQVCDVAAQMCRAGCREDGECGARQVCDPGLAACIGGCREDAGCGSGEICDRGLCRLGCRDFGGCTTPYQCIDTECRMAPVTSLSAGSDFTCAVAGGTPFCWGNDDGGKASPPAGTSATQVVAGPGGACASTSSVAGSTSDSARNNRVVCWGDSRLTAVPDRTNQTTWGGASQGWYFTGPLGVGDGFACHRTRTNNNSERSHICWGAVPATLNPANTNLSGTRGEAVALSGGDNVMCFNRGEGTSIACDGPTDQLSSSISGKSELAVGGTFYLGVNQNTSSTNRLLWAGARPGRSGTPTLPGDTGWTSVTAGSDFGCAISTRTIAGEREADGVVCFGPNNNDGQLAPPTGRFERVSAGAAHACAVVKDGGAIRCWGRNDKGQATPPPAGGRDPLPAPTTVTVSNNQRLEIPSNDPGGIRSDVSVTTLGRVKAVRVDFDIETNPGTNPNLHGLTISLVRGGHVVGFASDPRDNRGLTLLNFNGVYAEGTWGLRVEHNRAGEPGGYLNGWTLHLDLE